MLWRRSNTHLGEPDPAKQARGPQFCPQADRNPPGGSGDGRVRGRVSLPIPTRADDVRATCPFVVGYSHTGGGRRPRGGRCGLAPAERLPSGHHGGDQPCRSALSACFVRRWKTVPERANLRHPATLLGRARIHQQDRRSPRGGGPRALRARAMLRRHLPPRASLPGRGRCHRRSTRQSRHGQPWPSRRDGWRIRREPGYPPRADAGRRPAPSPGWLPRRCDGGRRGGRHDGRAAGDDRSSASPATLASPRGVNANHPTALNWARWRRARKMPVRGRCRSVARCSTCCWSPLSLFSGQVAQTRILSALCAYHYVFLVTSLALLGLGLGGMVVLKWPDLVARFERTPATCLAELGLALAGAISASLSPSSARPLPWAAPSSTARLGMLPFTWRGSILSLLFTTPAARIGKFYLADLLGAGPEASWSSGHSIRSGCCGLSS